MHCFYWNQQAGNYAFLESQDQCLHGWLGSVPGVLLFICANIKNINSGTLICFYSQFDVIVVIGVKICVWLGPEFF